MSTHSKTLLLVFLISISINANDFDPYKFKNRKVTAVRISEPLVIDGILDEQLYSTQEYSDFVQYVPFNGQRASEKTEVWIGYDESAIYVGARMWDSEPDNIDCKIGRRDENSETDLFEVIIDSYNDNRTGFSFQINPAGAINDESYYNDVFTETSWDGIWKGKTNIDDKGWTAEMRIPYSQLRFDKKSEYTWGILPCRKIQRKDEWDFFTYVSLEESGIIRHAAELNGLNGITPPKRSEIRPFLTSSTSILPDKKDNIYYKGKENKYAIGADFKLGVGSNITIDGTINPDFGQVEVDPSEINLSAYETYYTEKRPFFIEGQDAFQFGKGGPTYSPNIKFTEPRLFYSRRIGRQPYGRVFAHPDSVKIPGVTNILGAMKVSGKLKGDWSIGGLTALTDQEFAQYQANGIKSKELIEPATYYNVIRVQKSIKNGKHGLGFMGTSVIRFMNGLSFLSTPVKDHDLYDKLSDKATTLGVDAWTFLGSNNDWGIGAWIGISQVSGTAERIVNLQRSSSHYFQRPDADHVEINENLKKLSGYAGRIKLNKETGNVLFNASLGLISPSFESNDLGYQGMTDVINSHIGIGYSWREPGKYIRYARSDIFIVDNHDFSGIKILKQYRWSNWIDFNNSWSIYSRLIIRPETLNNSVLRGGPKVIDPFSWGISEIGFESDDRKKITVGSFVGFSKNKTGIIDYYNLSEVDFKINDRININLETWARHNINNSQYISSIDDENNTVMYGKRYVVGRLNQTTFYTIARIDYAFTPKLTLQSYIQPFMSAGSYTDIKEYAKPESYEFIRYGEDNNSTISKNENGYIIDPTGGDTGDSFSIYNPDFNYKALIGTLVLRWEFSPGASLYFVWTHNGTNYDHPGDFSLGRDLKDLINTKADDIFAIKLSYWIGK